ncbi:hypothetical protein LTR53_018709, partial [Teratosphaeriaceae sp. CCFEE 6253]
AKPSRSQRRTYLVLRNGPKDTKRRLVCFTEEKAKAAGPDDGSTGAKKSEHVLHGGDVFGIAVVPSGDAGLHVLVSYADGKVDCLSADLDKVVWQRRATQADEVVESAGLADAAAACKGLLAEREDVLAALDSGPGSTPIVAHLLHRVVRSGHQRTLQLFSIRPIAVDTIQSQKPGLHHLVDYALPAA